MFIKASIKLAETVLLLFMLHIGCVGSHRSTPTQDRPFHRVWSGGSAWASTSFPNQSGLMCLRRVRCILCVFSPSQTSCWLFTTRGQCRFCFDCHFNFGMCNHLDLFYVSMIMFSIIQCKAFELVSFFMLFLLLLFLKH